MAWGLPKLPGLVFSDPTKTQHHIRSSLRYYQGHRFPDTLIRGPGGTATDVDSNAFALPDDSVNYDPSLTYGRVKQPALPAVIPHWVHYDKRCLNFTAFFKQTVYENPDENYRVRVVNIVYFLEDDTMTVMEPRVKVMILPYVYSTNPNWSSVVDYAPKTFSSKGEQALAQQWEIYRLLMLFMLEFVGLDDLIRTTANLSYII